MQRCQNVEKRTLRVLSYVLIPRIKKSTSTRLLIQGPDPIEETKNEKPRSHLSNLLRLLFCLRLAAMLVLCGTRLFVVLGS